MSKDDATGPQPSLTQRALLAVKDLRAQLEEVERARREPIAIIGIGCRFPGGANDRESFWHMMREGRDATSEIPRERWDRDAYYDPDPDAPGKMYTRRGAFVEHVDRFDAAFFHIAPREALKMDPQQRFLLEVAWEALEDAGIPPDQLRGSATGVFVGIMHHDYSDLLHLQSDPQAIDAYIDTGRFFSVASGRLSYVLGLQGPSLSVDTACSASLVSVHLACQSLRMGECNLALAGGVNLLLQPESFIASSRLHSLASDGRCKTFDAAANGYVRGEGCGIVVLKRYSDARRDHDPILALIRGSAVTHDGASSGLTVPNGQAQQLAIENALSNAGLEPTAISYVEAHGTGTPLGDPIEVHALAAVYGKRRSAEQPLLVGSVKTNIGHLESAAGIAGLIKVVTALQHAEIPPLLHLQQVNPRIPLQELKLSIPTSVQAWNVAQGRRMAGINSLGISGTNVHMILEEAPQLADERTSQHHLAEEDALATHVGGYALLPISARSPQALHALAQAYSQFLAQDVALDDLCLSASLHRTHHEQRLALIGATPEDLRRQLAEFLAGQESTLWSTGCVRPGQRSHVVFVCPGQGSQWIGMARQLMRQEPTFLAELQRCEQVIHACVGWSVIEELGRSEAQSRLAQIDIVQPTLFAIQMALAALWRSYGIEPEAVIGHSMGEVAAACIAGALCLEDAVCVICLRSRLLKRLSGQGAMAVIALPLAETRRVIDPYLEHLSIAASNSPHATVVSGDPHALQLVQEQMQRQDISCTFVKVDVASHSPQTDVLRADLLQALQSVRPGQTSIPMYSTVKAQVIDGCELDAAYWVRNLREPVLFGETVQHLLDDGYRTFIELSPHPLLTVAVTEYLELSQLGGLALPSMRRGQDERAILLSSLGKLYVQGYPISWKGVTRSGDPISLPLYPWQGQRYWPEHLDEHDEAGAWQYATCRSIIESSTSERPFEGVRLPSPLSTIQLETLFDPARFTFLADHRLADRRMVTSVMVASGSSYLSLILSAARRVLHVQECRVQDLFFQAALIIPDGESRTVQLILTPQGPEQYRVEVYSHSFTPYSASAPDQPDWVLHATGILSTSIEPVQQANRAERALVLQEDTMLQPYGRDAIQARCPQEIEGTALYEECWHVGYRFGRHYQWQEHIWRGNGEALVRLRSPFPSDDVAHYELAPGIIDACIQVLCFSLLSGQMADIFSASALALYIPVSIKQIRFAAQPAEAVWAYGRLREGDLAQCEEREIIGGDIMLAAADGSIIATFAQVRLKLVSVRMLLRHITMPQSDWFYEVAWREHPLDPSVVGSLPRRTEGGHGELRRTEEGQANWLILSEDAAQGQALADEFTRRGVHAHPHADLQADLQAVLSAAQWQGIAYIARHSEFAVADMLTPHVEACNTLLTLTHLLTQPNSGKRRPRLWIMTQGAQPVPEPEPAHVMQRALEQATIWGLGRVIGLEHPDLWGGLVDLDPVCPAGCWSQVADEVLSSQQVEQVAFRQNRRYVARLLPASSSEQRVASPVQGLPGTPEQRVHAFREEATYLITGGLGGLGLLTARWMAEQGVRNLVLTGRSRPSTQAETLIAQLQQRGVRVEVMQGDVASAEQMDHIFRTIEDTLPPLRGVVHAAGVLDDALLLHQDEQHLQHVFAPKIAGAWHLHQRTRNVQLDFFVLYSSIVSLIGSVGQANYAAANAFLDALAQYRQAQHLPGLSINWGAWAETGLAQTRAIQQSGNFQGMELIQPAEGTAMLAELLWWDRPQVCVFPMDWSTCSLANDAVRHALFSELEQMHKQTVAQSSYAPQDATLARQLQEALPQQRQEILLDAVRSLIVQTLALDTHASLDTRRPLRELGFDSLMSVELRNKLKAATGCALPVTLIYDYPTLTALTRHLLSLLYPEDEDVAASSRQDVAAAEVDAGQQGDPELQAALQAELSQLSDEELEAILAQTTQQEER